MTSHTPTAAEVLDRELLPIRARLIDIAAALDRVQRATGSVAGDPRPVGTRSVPDTMEKIRRSLAVLAAGAADRAEQVQRIWSKEVETRS